MPERPLCKCHQEPMLLNGIRHKSGTQKFRCAVKKREGWHRYYDALPHERRSAMILRIYLWHLGKRQEELERMVSA